MISSKLPDVGTTIFSVMTALANDAGAVNLSQGFPDYAPDPALADLLTRAVRDGHNQYAPMPGVMRLREAVARKYAQMFDISVDPDTEITITPGGTAALTSAITAVVRPNDEVIVFEPAYDSYGPAIRMNGGIVRSSLMHAPSYRPDWDHVRSLLSPRTSMIIVNTPHNPCGSVLTAEDLDILAELTRTTRVVVLSDEVYELITYDDAVHRSVAGHPELRSRSFVVTSFGKTFHVTGWKVGACIAPMDLTVEFRKAHQFITFSVNTPAQMALADHMANPSTYGGLRSFFQAKRDLFRRLVGESRWTLRPCHGSYFQLLGYEKISNERDVDVAQRLVRDAGVAAIPLSPFTSGGVQPDTVLRFCFAKEDATLLRAAELLCAV
jgi:methionine aminotransferase